MAGAELLKAAAAFLKIGLMAFGGGISTVPIIKHELMAKNLLEPGKFLTLLGLSQVTPGPLVINGATLVGFYKGGLLGAALCTLSAILGPLALLYAAKGLFKTRPHLESRFGNSIKGPVTGLMVMAFLYIARSSLTGPMEWGLFLCSLLLASLGPLRSRYPLIVILSGAMGALFLR
ncbi:MAG: chromate transporter [Thermanaerothrix sp.]|nr:chromate transporter [Thermanaerothrix sp.]